MLSRVAQLLQQKIAALKRENALLRTRSRELVFLLELRELFEVVEDGWLELRDGMTGLEAASLNLRGVTFNSGRVVQIELSDSGLSGSIPDSIGCLTKMLDCNFRGNRLTGQIPSSFCQCSALGELDLGFNELNGGIPVEIGFLTQLNALFLQNNHLQGEIPWMVLAAMVQQRALRRIYLSNNRFQVQQLPAILSSMTNLEGLALSTLGFTGTIPAVWADTTHLDYLGLSGNSLSGSLPTRWPASLRTLLVRDNPGEWAPSVVIDPAP
jgi:hypothetical protein